MLVKVDDRTVGHGGQPCAELASAVGELAFAPAGMQWKADDQSLDVVFEYERAVMASVRLGATPLVDLERKGHFPPWVAEGGPDVPSSEIEAQDGSHG